LLLIASAWCSCAVFASCTETPILRRPLTHQANVLRTTRAQLNDRTARQLHILRWVIGLTTRRVEPPNSSDCVSIGRTDRALIRENPRDSLTPACANMNIVSLFDCTLVLVFMTAADPKTHTASESAGSGDGVAESHSDHMARLFREHNEALIRFLRKRLGSEQEAKEVAQEAYVRLLSLQAPHVISFLSAFLYKTAANLAIDRIRSRARQAVRTQDVLIRGELHEIPTPERELAGREDLARLAALINELPPKCQRALLLLRIYGLEYAEVAAQMGISERMVRIYLMRALVYCRAGLDEVPLSKDLRR
jgi:RNA polymerase sigma factor (sigma-70 family)